LLVPMRCSSAVTLKKRKVTNVFSAMLLTCSPPNTHTPAAMMANLTAMSAIIALRSGAGPMLIPVKLKPVTATAVKFVGKDRQFLQKSKFFTIVTVRPFEKCVFAPKITRGKRFQDQLSTKNIPNYYNVILNGI